MTNDDQLSAVKYDKGPLLLIAGAGTGKTYVLIEKIKYLISHRLAKPENILALTFTEKAASEMEERVDQALPYGYFQMWISTFHAFADQILKEHASHIGLNSGYRLLSDAEALLFLKENLFLFSLKYFRPLGNPNRYLEGLHKHFSRLKDEDISPNQYLTWVHSTRRVARKMARHPVVEKMEAEKYIELAQAYKIYEQLKIKEGLMDFSDLLYYALELFRRRPNIVKNYQKKFTHVLVDEFQDTNISQYALLKLLCPARNKPKLTIVGDDSQAIYKFRGASVSNILTFMKDYPQAKQITLRRNYRSSQKILDSAYRLIKHNDPDTLEARLGISKKLVSQKESVSDGISFHLAESVEDEADSVVRTIMSLKETYAFSDFAILIRANNHADPFARAFARKGIPYQFLGPGNLYKQPEIKDLIAYLKFLDSIDDSVSFYRVLSMEILNLDSKDIIGLVSYAKRVNLSLFQSLEIYLSFFYSDFKREEFEIYKKYIPLLRKETKEKLKTVYVMIQRHISLIKKETAGQILYYFLEDTGYLSKLASYKNEKDEKIALNISKFFNKLKGFESEHEDSYVSNVVSYIDMTMELGESPTVSEIDRNILNAVNILTVHSAKGLEFPVVFLVNLSRGRFPTYERKETIPIPDELIKEILPVGDYHLEEERRLFYVGLTRARDKIFLSSSRYYGEGKRLQRISPFVTEALGEEIIKKIGSEKKSPLIPSYSGFAFEKAVSYKIKKSPFKNTASYSYTQLETYKRCPLQYKYQYVLKIPTVQNAAISFGDTIHRTLQVFYTEFITNKTVGLERMLEAFRISWIPLGYASVTHENRMKKEGNTMLTDFFMTFHSNRISILDIEKTFKIKINKSINVIGKIDRVDKNDSRTIEIIDYKTGKIPQKEELLKSLQLSIYTLAAMDKGLYHKKLEDITLTFYYLQSMEKISFKLSSKQLQEAKDSIKKTVDEINASSYEARVGPWCDFCPFRMICEAWQ